MDTAELLQPAHMLYFSAGLGIAAAIGLIRRHEIYVRLMASQPLTFALDAWIRLHILRHPSAAELHIINAALSATSASPKGRDAPRG